MWGPSWNPSIEDIIALKPELVMIYTFPGSDIPAKLDEHRIPYAVDNEYLENTVLGRFEWIKFIGTFFEMDREAYEIYSGVERRWVGLLKRLGRRGSRLSAGLWFTVELSTPPEDAPSRQTP
jgi:iron complex transport system substrate-binding protein